MDNKNGSLWEEYESKFANIERKVGRVRSDGSVNAPGVEEAFGREKGPEGLLEDIEIRLGSLLAANNSLREELRFLKAEIEATDRLKNELARLRIERDIVKAQKDSETARLFARNSRLEEEISSLRGGLHERSRRVLESAVKSSRQRRQAIEEGNGILSWLSKPLIVVDTDK
jgi:cell division protein FtsB